MIDFKVNLLSEDAAAALRITTTKLRTTSRRVLGEIGHSLFLKVKPRVLAGETAPWFQRRIKGLLLAYSRVTNALRTSVTAQAIKATGSDKKGMVAAIECGGKYTQWVNPHTRLRTKVFGVPANPYTEHVEGYIRLRREEGKGYLAASIPEMVPKAEAMARAGFRILLSERREPTRDEIKAAV